MENLKHWTKKAITDFVYRVSSDFVAQVQTKLEKDGVSQTDLAQRLGVTVGRVSQVLNDPGNLTLKNTVQYARALGMKVAVIAYDDGDADNDKGPISSAVFNTCWRRMGAPSDLFQVANSSGVVQVKGAAPPLHGYFLSGVTSQNSTDWEPLEQKLIGTFSTQ